jgi:hypothetical protein
MNYQVNYGHYDDNEAVDTYDNTFYTRQEAADVAAQLVDEGYSFVDVWMKIPRPNGTAYSECVLSYEDGTLTEIVDDMKYTFEWNSEKMAYIQISEEVLDF